MIRLLRDKTRGLLRRSYLFRHGGEEGLTGEVTVGDATFSVEIAMTQERRYVGLGGRARVAPGTGMLFVFPDAAVREFCMRDCLVPLDIAFLSPQREVVSIYTMDVESGEGGYTQYAPTSPAMFALEVGAGELARAGVTAGLRATFSRGIPSAWLAAPGVVPSR